jgi:hypothetical protein
MPTPHVPARIAAASLLAASLLAAPALAEDCRTDGGPLTDLAKATVVARKAHFIAGTCAEDPSAQGCKVKAYLVAGDTVFLGPATGEVAMRRLSWRRRGIHRRLGGGR